MSHFLEKVKAYNAEIRRREQEEGISLPYSRMLSDGMMKPVSFRLPVTTAAQLDVLMGYGLWDSKQEMLYEILHSTIRDFLDLTSEEEGIQQAFKKAAVQAYEEWKSTKEGEKEREREAA